MNQSNVQKEFVKQKGIKLDIIKYEKTKLPIILLGNFFAKLVITSEITNSIYE